MGRAMGGADLPPLLLLLLLLAAVAGGPPAGEQGECSSSTADPVSCPLVKKKCVVEAAVDYPGGICNEESARGQVRALRTVQGAVLAPARREHTSQYRLTPMLFPRPRVHTGRRHAKEVLSPLPWPPRVCVF